MYPLLFEDNLHATVWGGGKIPYMKRVEGCTEPIGESWEVSAIPGSESVVSNGPLKGRKLNELVEEYGERLTGKSGKSPFPLLAKVIDAHKDLSIQVHPNDEIALRRHNKPGKTEMWYVIEAEENGRLIVGLDQKTTPEDLRRHIEAGTVTSLLRSYKVKKGDVFFIPSGRIHAICGGVLIAEIQQSCDVTYRLFDYNRPGLDGKPRQLHIEEGIEAVDYQVEQDYQSHYTHRLNEPSELAKCEYFTVNLLDLTKPISRKHADTFIIYMCIDGSSTVTAGGNTVTLEQGMCCLIPAEVADVTINPKEKSTIIETYL